MHIRTLVGLLPLVLLSACAGNSKPDTPPADTGNERCVAVTEQDIRDLFVRWNKSLDTLDPKQVLANYATRSILLPTVSNVPRITPEQKEAYFVEFLKHRPTGKIDLSFVDIGCNYAIDAGLYTFTYRADNNKTVPARYSYSYRYRDGQWLITSHHSSKLPNEVETASADE